MGGRPTLWRLRWIYSYRSLLLPPICRDKGRSLFQTTLLPTLCIDTTACAIQQSGLNFYGLGNVTNEPPPGRFTSAAQGPDGESV